MPSDSPEHPAVRSPGVGTPQLTLTAEDREGFSRSFAAGTFAVGDRVRFRDRHARKWRVGIVAEVVDGKPKMPVRPGQSNFFWDCVERAPELPGGAPPPPDDDAAPTTDPARSPPPAGSPATPMVPIHQVGSPVDPSVSTPADAAAVVHSGNAPPSSFATRGSPKGSPKHGPQTSFAAMPRSPRGSPKSYGQQFSGGRIGVPAGFAASFGGPHANPNANLLDGTWSSGELVAGPYRPPVTPGRTPNNRKNFAVPHLARTGEVQWQQPEGVTPRTQFWRRTSDQAAQSDGSNEGTSYVGGYQVVDFVDSGAYAEVFEARKDGRPYALKQFYRFRVDEDSGGRAQLNEEVRLMRGLRHRHVLRVHEALSTPTALWIALDWVPNGWTVRHEINERGNDGLGQADAARYLHETASGLAHCHARGIAHRDLKPRNLLLTPHRGEFAVIVADFGFAEVGAKRLGHGSPATPRGGALPVDALVGSTGYIAPEAYCEHAGAKPGAALRYCRFAADVWAAGCVYFEMLAGDMLDPAGDEIGAAALGGGAVAQRDVDRLVADRWESLPGGGESQPPPLLAKLLRRDPAARPRAEAIDLGLGDFAADLCSQDVPPAQPGGVPPPTFPADDPHRASKGGSGKACLHVSPGSGFDDATSSAETVPVPMEQQLETEGIGDDGSF